MVYLLRDEGLHMQPLLMATTSHRLKLNTYRGPIL